MSIQPPGAGKSDLELKAEAVAREAIDWAHEQSGGRTMKWDNMNLHDHAALVGETLTHMAIAAALKARES